MATPNVGILTTAGKALIDKVNSGQAKISFSKVVFSSMDNSQLSDTQIKALTAITPQEVVVSSPQTTLDTNSGETRIRATGTNEKLADGVYVKTYGVFAKDDTGSEILYGVTVSPNPNYFPAYDGVTPQAVTYSYKTVIQETSNITMTNSNDVYVSQEDLDEALKSLSKDDSVVHLIDNETIAGTKTFVTAPVDQKSGLPYITKAGVPDVPATLADTTKDTNFQKSLQVKGVDVATAADLKSIEDLAWREITNPAFQGSYLFRDNEDGTASISGTIYFYNRSQQYNGNDDYIVPMPDGYKATGIASEGSLSGLVNDFSVSLQDLTAYFPGTALHLYTVLNQNRPISIPLCSIISSSSTGITSSPIVLDVTKIS